MAFSYAVGILLPKPEVVSCFVVESFGFLILALKINIVSALVFFETEEGNFGTGLILPAEIWNSIDIRILYAISVGSQEE